MESVVSSPAFDVHCSVLRGSFYLIWVPRGGPLGLGRGPRGSLERFTSLSVPFPDPLFGRGDLFPLSSDRHSSGPSPHPTLLETRNQLTTFSLPPSLLNTTTLITLLLHYHAPKLVPLVRSRESSLRFKTGQIPPSLTPAFLSNLREEGSSYL